ncbi:MAG: hypothetical protein HKN36_13275 [Hellea sp.]|nr:hypothetical protein [Hellea sp.]
MKKAFSIILPIVATATMGIPALAGSPQAPGNNFIEDSSLQDATLTISGPNGYHQTSNANAPAMMYDGMLADGTYTWEVTGHNGKRIVTAKNSMNNGRGDAQRSFSYETVTQSGSFTIKNGVKVDTSLVEK